MTTHVLKWMKYSINLVNFWLWCRVSVRVFYFQQYFSYIMAVSCIGGGNHRSATIIDTLYHIILLVVIGTYFPGKSNYHTITTTKTPFWYFPCDR